MVNIGIIAEGQTDFLMLKKFMTCLAPASEYFYFTPIQPLFDETDFALLQSPPGWFQVLEYCHSERFAEAFDFNDFILIQIDTDVSEERHFEVSKRHTDGQERSVEEMIEAVKAKLISQIDEERFQALEKKILFAICVDSMECWLLPLFVSDPRKHDKSTHCLNTLNSALQREFGFSIDVSHKQVRYYEKLLRNLKKQKLVLEGSKRNPSFQVFVQSLFDKGCLPVESANL
jgi:hypothetical protein